MPFSFVVVSGAASRLTVYVLDTSNRIGWGSVADGYSFVEFLKLDTSNWGLGSGKELGFCTTLTI